MGPRNQARTGAHGGRITRCEFLVPVHYGFHTGGLPRGNWLSLADEAIAGRYLVTAGAISVSLLN